MDGLIPRLLANVSLSLLHCELVSQSLDYTRDELT